jgi:hypothetical protein
MRVAADGARVLAWVLLIAGFLVIALNPGVPSFGYALLWLGIMAIARGMSVFANWPTVAVDLSLLFLCVLGMEIGGLILVPTVLVFALADALRPRPDARTGARHELARRPRSWRHVALDPVDRRHDRVTMNRRVERHRVVSIAAAAALSIAAAALALHVLDATAAATALRGLLASGDPDLALAYPLNHASDIGSAEAVASAVLAVVLVLGARRILFALAAIWSLVLLGTLALVLSPAEPVGLIWSVRPVVPYEMLNATLVLACLFCLATASLGCAITPFGWDWLSAPSDTLLPPVSAPHRG